MTFADQYGPWAVVAGASEGIGREFARQLAALGVPSVLVSRRQGPLDELAREILTETGVECLPVAVDLSHPDASAQVAAAVGDREVGLYIRNAGADPNGSRFLDADVQTWTTHLQRNVMSTMQECHYFGRLMRERGRGGLLLIGSGACYSGGSFLAAYSGGKAFEMNFGESLWTELRPFGVHVLYMALNMTDTPAFRTLLNDRNQPLPNDWAAPADVARVGLERLADGPVYNWDQDDDEVGSATTAASVRRARVLATDAGTHAIFDKIEVAS